MRQLAAMRVSSCEVDTEKVCPPDPFFCPFFPTRLNLFKRLTSDFTSVIEESCRHVPTGAQERPPPLQAHCYLCAGGKGCLKIWRFLCIPCKKNVSFFRSCYCVDHFPAVLFSVMLCTILLNWLKYLLHIHCAFTNPFGYVYAGMFLLNINFSLYICEL